MDYEMYEVKTDNFFDREYVFYTDGRHGRVKRAVDFYRSDSFPENIFDIYVSSILDVEDYAVDAIDPDINLRQEVLLTVTEIVLDFLRINPSAVIHCIGVPARLERLHQMIMQFLSEKLSDEYIGYGRTTGDEWQVVEQGSCFHEHLFFRKDYDIATIAGIEDKAVNHASAEFIERVIESRDDPRQFAMEEEYFYCFAHLGVPEPLRRKLTFKRRNGDN